MSPSSSNSASLRPIGDGRTRMSIESRFQSVEEMEQVLAMGMEEGTRAELHERFADRIATAATHEAGSEQPAFVGHHLEQAARQRRAAHELQAFAQAGEAHSYMESRKNTGKVILVP